MTTTATVISHRFLLSWIEAFYNEVYIGHNIGLLGAAELVVLGSGWCDVGGILWALGFPCWRVIGGEFPGGGVSH